MSLYGERAHFLRVRQNPLIWGEQRIRGNTKGVYFMKAGTIWKKTAALFLVVVLLTGLTVFAEGIDDEIDQAKTEMDEEKQNLISTEDRIAALESSKNSSEEYLKELSIQLDDLNNELIDISTKLEEKERELAQIQSELQRNRELAAEQYEDMKIRIQYLYETGTSAGLFASLFSAESFTEFLNRAENYSELTKYDRQMLSDYETTLQEIEDHESKLLAEKEEILSIRDELYARRSKLQELYQAVYLDMTEYISALDASKAEQLELIEELQYQADRMNELLRQQYEEEAARLQEEQRIAEEEALRAAQEAETLLEAQEDSYEGSEDPAEYGETSVPYEETPNTDETAPYDESLEGGSDHDGSSEDETQDNQSQDDADQENGNAENPEEDNGEAEQTDSENKDSAGSDLTYLGNFTLTAYCPCSQCCGAYASGYTASGTLATEGVTVAMGGVDFGTKICINGHIYTVEDRGTAYGHVDIFFSSHADALAFGLQYADVYQVN